MIEQIRNLGLNSDTLYAGSLLSILLSIAVWLLVRGEDRAGAERFGIFVGLWAPTVMVLAKAVEDAEKAS
jgi:hypothetical protein